MAAPGLFWRSEEKLDPMPDCPRVKGLPTVKGLREQGERR